MLDIFTVEVCTSMVTQLVKLIITVCVRVGNSASKVDYNSAYKDGCYTLNILVHISTSHAHPHLIY